MGTIIGIIIAFLLTFHVPPETFPSIHSAAPLFISTGCLFLLISVLMNIYIFFPLQSAESMLTPRVIELFRRDIQIIAITGGLLFFSLISFIYALDLPLFHGINPQLLYGVWIVLLGLSFDLFFLYFRRILGYFNPYKVVRQFTQEAQKSTLAEKDEELCQWVDALTEVATKTINRSASALCQEAIGEMQIIVQHYMDTVKTIGHTTTTKDEPNQNNEIALGRDADQVSYILFYVLQRLEFINQEALTKHLEPICSSIITTLSKIAVYAAKFDLSLVSYPVHFMGRAALKAEENDLTEIPVKTILALLEVSKTILREVDFTYLDLKDPFLSIVSNLEDVTKAMFKKDKEMNIKILVQPFIDLKELFKEEKVAAHQDTPVILNNINRVLGEYEALDTIMKTMPPIAPQE